MVTLPRLTMLVVLVAALSSLQAVRADGPPAYTTSDNCPTGSCYGQTPCPPPAYYSPFRYWTPALARVYDNHCGPKISVYAPDRHPEIPVSYNILPYHCPPANPEATILTPPTPPNKSTVR